MIKIYRSAVKISVLAPTVNRFSGLAAHRQTALGVGRGLGRPQLVFTARDGGSRILHLWKELGARQVTPCSAP